MSKKKKFQVGDAVIFNGSLWVVECLGRLRDYWIYPFNKKEYRSIGVDEKELREATPLEKVLR